MVLIHTSLSFQILESDIVSKKICKQCLRNTKKIVEIRKTAAQQDQRLKDVCQGYLTDKGIRLPNTSVTIKKDKSVACSDRPAILSEIDILQPQIKTEHHQYHSTFLHPVPVQSADKIRGVRGLHSSVIGVFRKYPRCKLPKKTLDKHVAPDVTLTMGEVEKYFIEKKLKLEDHICKSERETSPVKEIRRFARKRTTAVFKSVKSSKDTDGVIAPQAEGHSASDNNVHMILSASSDDSSCLMTSEEYRLKLLDDSTVKPVDGSSKSSDNGAETVARPSPEFIQSLGLTPAVSEGPVNPLRCTICGCVQTNMAAMRTHSSRHRICRYCKTKFKTVEKKEHHINNYCHIRNLIAAPTGMFVDLERVELNLTIRRRYRSAFLYDFDDIPGLEEPAASRLTEESPERNDSATVLRPVIRIQNDDILSKMSEELAEEEVIFKLISKLWGEEDNRSASIERRNKTTWSLSGLKAQVVAHRVPIEFVKRTHQTGDSNVTYAERSVNDDEQPSPVLKTLWNDAPLVRRKPRVAAPPQNISSTVINTYPMTFPQLSLSSIQVMTATNTMSFILPSTSTFIHNLQPTSITNNVAQTQTFNNTFYGPVSNTTIQTSPLLQGYAVNVPGSVSVINNQMPVQSTNINCGEASTSGSVAATATVTTGSSAAGPAKATKKRKKKKPVPSRSGKAPTGVVKKPLKRRLVKTGFKTGKAANLKAKNVWKTK